MDATPEARDESHEIRPQWKYGHDESFIPYINPSDKALQAYLLCEKRRVYLRDHPEPPPLPSYFSPLQETLLAEAGENKKGAYHMSTAEAL